MIIDNHEKEEYFTDNGTPYSGGIEAWVILKHKAKDGDVFYKLFKRDIEESNMVHIYMKANFNDDYSFLESFKLDERVKERNGKDFVKKVFQQMELRLSEDSLIRENLSIHNFGIDRWVIIKRNGTKYKFVRRADKDRAKSDIYADSINCYMKQDRKKGYVFFESFSSFRIVNNNEEFSKACNEILDKLNA